MFASKISGQFHYWADCQPDYSGFVSLICYNLDGIFEVFNSLDNSKKEIISETIRKIIQGINDDAKRKLLLVIPEAAKIQIRI